MAGKGEFQIKGMDELRESLKRIGEVPNEVKVEIVTAMADVAANEFRKTIREMGVYDEDRTGKRVKHLADVIVLTKPKVSHDRAEVSVTYRGTRVDKDHKTPTRNAEIAFINEYGKPGQPARPFMRRATARARKRIEAAGQQAWDRWLDKQ